MFKIDGFAKTTLHKTFNVTEITNKTVENNVTVVGNEAEYSTWEVYFEINFVIFHKRSLIDNA